jgi:hypothetical protein
MCDVMFIEIYSTYLHGKCFLIWLYSDMSSLTPQQSALLSVSSDTQVHVSMPLIEAVHYTQTNITFLPVCGVLRFCFFSKHMQHHLFFPLQGQCCKYFASSRLNWDANGLGVSLEMPLAVTFSSPNNQFANKNLPEMFVCHLAAT